MGAEIEIVSDRPVGRKARVEKEVKVHEEPAGEDMCTPAKGSEVVVEVVRIPANPRMVICVWRGEGQERVVKVWVGRNARFKVGMRLKVRVGLNGAGNEPWDYEGPLPRFHRDRDFWR
jgi:hypothetical protein